MTRYCKSVRWVPHDQISLSCDVQVIQVMAHVCVSHCHLVRVSQCHMMCVSADHVRHSVTRLCGVGRGRWLPH